MSSATGVGVLAERRPGQGTRVQGQDALPRASAVASPLMEPTIGGLETEDRDLRVARDDSRAEVPIRDEIRTA